MVDGTFGGRLAIPWTSTDATVTTCSVTQRAPRESVQSASLTQELFSSEEKPDIIRLIDQAVGVHPVTFAICGIALFAIERCPATPGWPAQPAW